MNTLVVLVLAFTVAAIASPIDKEIVERDGGKFLMEFMALEMRQLEDNSGSNSGSSSSSSSGQFDINDLTSAERDEIMEEVCEAIAAKVEEAGAADCECNCDDGGPRPQCSGDCPERPTPEAICERINTELGDAGFDSCQCSVDAGNVVLTCPEPPRPRLPRKICEAIENRVQADFPTCGWECDGEHEKPSGDCPTPEDICDAISADVADCQCSMDADKFVLTGAGCPAPAERPERPVGPPQKKSPQGRKGPKPEERCENVNDIFVAEAMDCECDCNDDGDGPPPCSGDDCPTPRLPTPKDLCDAVAVISNYHAEYIDHKGCDYKCIDAQANGFPLIQSDSVDCPTQEGLCEAFAELINEEDPSCGCACDGDRYGIHCNDGCHEGSQEKKSLPGHKRPKESCEDVAAKVSAKFAAEGRDCTCGCDADSDDPRPECNGDDCPTPEEVCEDIADKVEEKFGEGCECDCDDGGPRPQCNDDCRPEGPLSQEKKSPQGRKGPKGSCEDVAAKVSAKFAAEGRDCTCGCDADSDDPRPECNGDECPTPEEVCEDIADKVEEKFGEGCECDCDDGGPRPQCNDDCRPEGSQEKKSHSINEAALKEKLREEILQELLNLKDKN